MKKLISVLISIIAVFAVSTAFAVPAFAAVDVYSPQGTKIEHSVNDPKLNGGSSNQVTGASVSAGSNKAGAILTILSIPPEKMARILDIRIPVNALNISPSCLA